MVEHNSGAAKENAMSKTQAKNEIAKELKVMIGFGIYGTRKALRNLGDKNSAWVIDAVADGSMGVSEAVDYIMI